MSEVCHINYLPIETLQRIFLLLPNGKHTHQVLPDVCKQWRSVIYSSTHLWNEITLSGYLDGISVEGELYIWGNFVERAGDSLLDIMWEVMALNLGAQIHERVQLFYPKSSILSMDH
jgi:hypothetical protein